MKKQKKFLIATLVFFTILLSSCNAFATGVASGLKAVEFSDEFKQYMEMTSEEREKVLMPRMFDVKSTGIATRNPFKLSRLVGSSLDTDYSLQETIPANMVIKNQNPTNSCWAFSSLAMLESTLALKDYNYGKAPVVYDFSERHMEYASSSQSFLDGVNTNGFNRKVGTGGNSYYYIPYLTNGTGAVLESALPFEPNENEIYLSNVQNKKVVTQVNDVITFPSYSPTDNLTQIKQQIKEHIKNHGGIDAGIHGASISLDSVIYNNDTGAIYCPDSSTYPIDHAVVIVGWDDDYSVENFVESNRPTNPGAWIIKNSWGTEVERYSLTQMKEIIIQYFPDNCTQNGWTDVTMISNDEAKEFFVNLGFTIENDEAVTYIGDKGFMYVSYEDANIYLQLTGITNAQNEVTYENIYQYDNFGYGGAFGIPGSKIYLATVFDRASTTEEYLTQVAISTLEKYTCKVYVNPNGTSKDMNSLQQVELATGETETIDVGYHTIEFAEPVKINSDSFVVVLEVVGENPEEISVLVEVNYSDFLGENIAKQNGLEIYDNVTIAQNKCFVATEAEMQANQWEDGSTKKASSGGTEPNFDTTLKAFTTSKILESVEITTAPTKTEYLLGESFDTTGMTVKANYTNGTSKEVTDYSIANGKDLMLNQTSVTIVYQGKTVEQPIEVVENVVEEIQITTQPTKTEYLAGEDFDATGMVVKAIYTDGTEEQITEYEIEDGEVLLNGQTSVTISYEGKTATQDIVVNENNVVKLEITQEPNKVTYVVGQSFNPEGMIVKATYESGLERNVTRYTIDETNVSVGETFVVITFEGQTVNQEITVVEKSVTSIEVKTMPEKTEYLLNEELDLTGGVIEVSYNDETKEEVRMTSEDVTVTGFDSESIGTKTIILTYESKTVQFEVKVKELEKPENSNFDNIKANVKSIKAYFFTDESKEDYVVLDVEVNDIIKSTVNENMEYYYYLSATPNAENITDWVKINTTQNAENKIQFEINTKDLSNYEELLNAETIYLYVKEVAIRNNMSNEKISISLALKVEDLSVENYVNGVKTEIQTPGTGSTPGQGTDNTTAPGTIPNAGKNIFVICLAVVVLVIGRIAYKKYKDIEIK